MRWIVLEKGGWFERMARLTSGEMADVISGIDVWGRTNAPSAGLLASQGPCRS